MDVAIASMLTKLNEVAVAMFDGDRGNGGRPSVPKQKDPGKARKAIFEDPVLKGFVVAYEFSASDTTPRCVAMDGKIFKVANPIWDTWTPPFHDSCCSVLIPITKVDEWDGIESEPPNEDELKSLMAAAEESERQSAQETASTDEWFRATKGKTLSLIPAGGIQEAELYRLLGEAFSGDDSISTYRLQGYLDEFRRRGLVRREKNGRNWTVYLLDRERTANIRFDANNFFSTTQDLGKWFETVEHKTFGLIPTDGIFESDLIKQVRDFMSDDPPSAYRISEYLAEFEKEGKIRRIKEGRRAKVFLVSATTPSVHREPEV